MASYLPKDTNAGSAYQEGGGLYALGILVFGGGGGGGGGGIPAELYIWSLFLGILKIYFRSSIWFHFFI